MIRRLRHLRRRRDRRRAYLAGVAYARAEAATRHRSLTTAPRGTTP